jgi:hypothetical protein
MERFTVALSTNVIEKIVPDHFIIHMLLTHSITSFMGIESYKWNREESYTAQKYHTATACLLI